MHDEFDSLGAALFLKAPAIGAATADAKYVLAGCLVNAAYKIGDLTITSRKCLSDYNPADDKQPYERKRATFRAPGEVTGVLVYGPDEFEKLIKFADTPPDKPWEVQLRLTDHDDLTKASSIAGKAYLMGGELTAPEDGGRLQVSVTVPFAEKETFTKKASS